MKRFKIISVFLIPLLVWPLFNVKIKAQDRQADVQTTVELQSELDAVEREIAQFEQQLTSVKSEKNSLNKKINELKLQQSKIKAQIQQTTLNLQGIELNLIEVENSIKERQNKISFYQAALVDLLRSVNQQDHRSVLSILATKKSVGDFLETLKDYEKITASLKATVDGLTGEAAALADDQIKLEGRRDDQHNLISIQNLQNSKLVQNLTERKDLLNQTNQQESEYQKQLTDRQARAAEIKNRIYDLLGISKQVTFGQAVAIAQWAESQTGVRSAFLLAILTQESNLGKNVGTCNRQGDPPEKSWKVVMKPTRDQEPFKIITAELGMDPDVTPVSCPMKDSKGNQVGWGGAMGPAQFIPSTWIGYRDKVAAITGKSANPWDIRDAFLAAAILSKANGAGIKAGEWAAAMRYFSGGTNTKFRFYGDNVVALAEKYQEDIDDLNDAN